VSPPIIGIRLDGSVAGTAVVPDTDGGRWDGDQRYDRAVGPMQFLPGTWQRVGVGACPGHPPDPTNILDAAPSAGWYLCGGGRDLGTQAGRWAAAYAYNPSGGYAAEVLGLADAFRTGTRPTSAPPANSPPTSAPPTTSMSTSTTSSPAATSSPATTSSPTATRSPTSTSSTSSTTASTDATTGSASSSDQPPVIAVRLELSDNGHAVTARWQPASGLDRALEVTLQRRAADGSWSPDPLQRPVTAGPDADPGWTWTVPPGRYRVSVSAADAQGSEAVLSDPVQRCSDSITARVPAVSARNT
jgi:hypothetical protein